MISIRQAQLEDARLVYVWRSEPTFKQYFFSAAPSSYEDHLDWFRQSLGMKTRMMFLILDKNIPVGFLRFDKEGETAEVGICIALEYHGKGYGTKGLEEGICWLRKNDADIKKVVARILPENTASQKAFAKAGFEVSHYVYQVKI